MVLASKDESILEREKGQGYISIDYRWNNMNSG